METMDKIIITERRITVTGENIWMTAVEIADLFNVCPAQVNRAIKKLIKNGVLKDYEVCRYIHRDEKYSVDVYSMDAISPLAYQWNTYYTDMFRRWLIEKAVSGRKGGQQIFIQYGKGFVC